LELDNQRLRARLTAEEESANATNSKTRQSEMAIEMLVGLNIIDDVAYQSYRDEIAPILTKYGGGFGYDFKIAEVFKSKTKEPINRVFTIYFANDDAMDAFFSNEEYLNIKARLFESSVTNTTIIAKWNEQ